jgi:hypothetical protein
MQDSGMELDDYFPGSGQDVIFSDSGHRLIIGLATDGSTYLTKETWLPVARRDVNFISITVSKIGNYNEDNGEIYSLVKADLLLFQSKLQQVVSDNKLQIILNFDVTMLDGIPGKREFGSWLVTEHNFAIRSVPDSLEIRYMNDNMAANLYWNAKRKLSSTTEEKRIAKLQKEINRQLQTAFVFTIKLADLTGASVDVPNRLKRRRIVIDDDEDF